MSTHGRFSGKNFFISLITLLFLVGVGAYAYSFISDYLALKDYKNSRDVTVLKKRLEKHMHLPKEEPMVATLTDADNLKKEQSFYKNAKNGDKVFIWKDKAVIYRPDEDKIVDFGIIFPEDQPAAQAGAEAPIAISILVTEKQATTAAKLKLSLEENKQQVKTVSVEKAKNMYKQTIVYDAKGTNGEAVDSIAEALRAQVAKALPDGEKAAGSPDVVIIMGQNIE